MGQVGGERDCTYLCCHFGQSLVIFESFEVAAVLPEKTRLLVGHLLVLRVLWVGCGENVWSPCSVGHTVDIRFSFAALSLPYCQAGTYTSQDISESMTKVSLASAPSAMKIMVVAPSNSVVLTVGARR